MKRQRGSALLIALIVVSLGVVVGLAVLEFASGAYSRTVSDQRLQQLRNIAEAGIERAKYEMMTREETDLSITDSLSGGLYEVTTTMEGPPATAVKVTSTATLNGQSLTITRLIGPGFHVPRPFDYALAINGYDWDEDVIRTGGTGVTSSVRLNGNLTWTSKNCTIFGDLILSGSVLGQQPSVSGQVLPNMKPLWFPSYDIALYKTVGYVREGSTGATAPAGPGNNVVLVFTGDLTLSGGVSSGSGIIVVGGTLRFRSSSNTFGPGSRWVYLAPKVVVDAKVERLDGFFYVPNGSFETKGELEVRGSIACRELNTGDDLKISHDPIFSIDPDAGWNMKVPGYWP